MTMDKHTMLGNISIMNKKKKIPMEKSLISTSKTENKDYFFFKQIMDQKES